MRLLKHPLLYVWLAFLGALVAAGLIPDKALPEQQQEQAAESKQAAEAKKAERIPSAIAKGTQPKKDKEAAKQGNGEREKEQKRFLDFTLTDALVALFTGVLTIVAGLQAYYTWGTMVATKLAARAALRSAVTANRTVDTMRETAERQLRAYLSPAVVRMGGFAAASEPDASVTIKNTGQTPAYNMLATVGMIIADRRVEQNFPVIPAPLYMSRGTLGAGTEITLKHGPSFRLSTSDHAAVVNGSLSIYLAGQIVYTDVFGRQRTTKLRLIFNDDCVKRDDGTMSVCAEGNDAD